MNPTRIVQASASAAMLVAATLVSPASAAPVTFRAVALEGDQAPGADGATFVGCFICWGNAPDVNDSGAVAFIEILTGPGVTDSNDRGYWQEVDSRLSLLAREGMPVPGGSTVFTDFGQNPQVNNAGTAAFVAGTSSGGALFRGTAETLTAVDGGGGPPALNDQGRVAFLRSDVIIAESESGLSPVVSAGDAAPGLPGDVSFRSVGFFTGAFDNAGNVAFSSRLQGTGIEFSNDDTIWRQEGASLHLVAQEGDDVPGMPGVTFGLVLPPDLNDLGQVAFLSRLSGDGLTPFTDAAIFRETAAGLEVVAREGDAAPGLDGAVLFNFRQPVLNDLGRIAFFAINDSGLWAEDPLGELSLVAAVGQSIEIAPGDVRTIDRLMSNGTWSFGFNNAGQTVFAANFADGSSGVILATFVPEPQLATMLALAGLALILARRKRMDERSTPTARQALRSDSP